MKKTITDYFTPEEIKNLESTISDAEKLTSGELRVHIQKKCAKDVIKAATLTFKKMGMTKTKAKNGVLIFVAVDDKKFAIIGDSGIDEKVPNDFWISVKEKMQVLFVKGDFFDALKTGIRLSGEKLAHYFPIEPDDINELPETISFG